MSDSSAPDFKDQANAYAKVRRAPRSVADDDQKIAGTVFGKEHEKEQGDKLMSGEITSEQLKNETSSTKTPAQDVPQSGATGPE